MNINVSQLTELSAGRIIFCPAFSILCNFFNTFIHVYIQVQKFVCVLFHGAMKAPRSGREFVVFFFFLEKMLKQNTNFQSCFIKLNTFRGWPNCRRPLNGACHPHMHTRIHTQIEISTLCKIACLSIGSVTSPAIPQPATY